MHRWKETLELRREAFNQEWVQLQSASLAETKSSAGDKYETAREMMAQSRRILERNVSETQDLIAGLDRMLKDNGMGPIHFGSLVRLKMGWHLVGLNLGVFTWNQSESENKNESEVRAVSLVSPLGLVLKGLTLGENFQWRGQTLSVLEIQID